jgi:hypothetical protein
VTEPGHPSLADVEARVVFVPVRHHSPTCARVVVELAHRLKPDAILIEGPSDFNDRIDELTLGHHLPIAIYSHVRMADGSRCGAYYPFCVYSPEWQAIESGKKLGAVVRFIDLPFGDVARFDRLAQRYADAEMKGGAYVQKLCRRVGVDDFDALWDDMFEVDPTLTMETYLERGHAFCGHLRRLDGRPKDVDLRREAFMAEQIRQAMDEFPGRILVVTGGFHSPALHDRLYGKNSEEAAESTAEGPAAEERGIALTPYSYERLDNLKGYESGMPNPGFYHQTWIDGSQASASTHRRLLAKVAKILRDRKQAISAADLIAAETTARALASIRGHAVVWRRDLVDGIAAALVKDESGRGQTHPLLEAIHEVFRGGEVGRLAEGTLLPPLVHDIKARLAEHGWDVASPIREIEVDLDTPIGLDQSRLLHRLALLGITGFKFVGGTNFAVRDDLSKCWERWQLHWSPERDATAIEASRYGPTLPEAASACLLDAANQQERSALAAAKLLLEAVLAGLDSVAGELEARLTELIRMDGDFFSVASALGHLLHLYRHDATLGTRGRGDVGALLVEAFDRSLWLFECLGEVSGQDKKIVDGVRAMLDTFERCASDVGLDRSTFVDLLARMRADPSRMPVIRGAAMGASWTLGEADPAEVRTALRLFADPSKLGDFLTGLFALAREAVQRQTDLILGIDELLAGFANDGFLEALPSLRLAFTYFTPREKHHMARSLMEALGLDPHAQSSLVALEYGPEVAARALAFEARLFQAVEKYGIRGGQRR